MARSFLGRRAGPTSSSTPPLQALACFRAAELPQSNGPASCSPARTTPRSQLPKGPAATAFRRLLDVVLDIIFLVSLNSIGKAIHVHRDHPCRRRSKSKVHMVLASGCNLVRQAKAEVGTLRPRPLNIRAGSAINAAYASAGTSRFRR
jgi:hypothetical protein